MTRRDCPQPHEKWCSPKGVVGDQARTAASEEPLAAGPGETHRFSWPLSAPSGSQAEPEKSLMQGLWPSSPAGSPALAQPGCGGPRAHAVSSSTNSTTFSAAPNPARAHPPRHPFPISPHSGSHEAAEAKGDQGSPALVEQDSSESHWRSGGTAGSHPSSLGAEPAPQSSP